MDPYRNPGFHCVNTMDLYRNPGFHHGSIQKPCISSWIHVEILDFNTRNPIYRLYPRYRYRYRLKYSFDTDLSVKLYPEYKESNIQIVSKIQIQVEISVLIHIDPSNGIHHPNCICQIISFHLLLGSILCVCILPINLDLRQ